MYLYNKNTVDNDIHLLDNINFSSEDTCKDHLSVRNHPFLGKEMVFYSFKFTLWIIYVTKLPSLHWLLEHLALSVSSMSHSLWTSE